MPAWHLIHFGWCSWEVTGRENSELQVAMSKIFTLHVLYAYKPELAELFLTPSQWFWWGLRIHREDGDGVGKAQLVVELQPKIQVKGCPWNDIWTRQLGAVSDTCWALSLHTLLSSNPSTFLQDAPGVLPNLSAGDCIFFIPPRRDLSASCHWGGWDLGRSWWLLGGYWGVRVAGPLRHCWKALRGRW